MSNELRKLASLLRNFKASTDVAKTEKISHILDAAKSLHLIGKQLGR